MAVPPSSPIAKMERVGSCDRWYADIEEFLAHFDESLFPNPMQRDELTLACGAFPDSEVSFRTGHLPTIKLRLETAHGSKVSALIELPKNYPERDTPTISFKSVAIPSVILRALEKQLEDELQDMFSMTGCVNLLTLFARAMETVRDLPVSSQSDHFGACMMCNRRLMRERQPKACQPLVCTFDQFGALTSSKCLLCQSANVLYTPALKPNVEAACDMCFVEDNPLIELECGCKSCVGCFQAFGDVETGEKRVAFSKRHGMYGISCPNHRGALIVDPALMKLLSTRAFGRYNLFALLDFAASHQIFVCPLPNCCGYPTCSGVHGGLMQCGFCKRFACVRCERSALDCQCQELVPDQIRNYFEQRVFTPVHRARQPYAGVVSSDPQVTLMLFYGSQKHIVTLPSSQGSWSRSSLIADIIFPFKEEQMQFIWSGLPVAKGMPLCDMGLYSGAVVFLVPVLDQSNRDRGEEISLWTFRRQIAADKASGAPAKELPAGGGGLYKKCPKCAKPVIHYFMHGCHHMGAHGSCCGFHWCYLCGQEYPGCKCPIFCQPDCKCPRCPECKPFRPCVLCPGCPACNVEE